MQTIVIIAALCALVGNAMVAGTGVPRQVPQSAATTIERLDGLQQPSARSTGTLTQAEAIRLAKTAAKKEKGKQFEDYDLNSVIFDPTNREWTASFDPKPPLRSSLECLVVIVKDETRETKVFGCVALPAR